MKITYIFRSPSKERSIERVFAPIMEQMKADRHKVHESFSKTSRLWPLSMLYNIIKYSVVSRQKGVFHITGDIQYVACLMNPKNTILTIHDCVMLHNENAPVWLKKMVYKLWYEIPLKRLKYITCISETTRQDLISFFPWIANKVIVIPNSVNTNFEYREKKFNMEKPVILHIGTRTNKNLERVIQALNGINCHLKIIGKLSENQIKLLADNKIYYSNDIHISDEQIVKEYEEADIISFPSLFEGFGMPIIEGQTVGRPVVTSNQEPMKSVAGEGAVLVSPTNIEDIKNAFLTLIENSEYRKKVIEAGLMNARLFRASNIASLYLEYYKDKLNHESSTN